MEPHSTFASYSDCPRFKQDEMIWGPSAAMHAVRRVINDVAPKDIPVLIIGEGGTGKGLLAVQIHRLSKHHNEPFTRVNCRSLIAGHTSECAEDVGKAEGISSEGTLFLDNVCEPELKDQRRVLDLLPEESDSSKGTSRIRVVSATRETLDEELRAGEFLKDLYFRLNGISVRMPPLRERTEDLPELTHFFLDKYGTLFDRPSMTLSREVLARMADYSWPGNVRQLENTVKRMVVTGEVESALDDLVEIGRATPRPNVLPHSSLKKAVREVRREVERQLIARALNKNSWNRKRAARELQISYKSLLSKMKQMGAEE